MPNVHVRVVEKEKLVKRNTVQAVNINTTNQMKAQD